MTRSGVWILLVSLAAPAAAQATGPCSPQPGIGNFALTGGLFGMVGVWIGVGVDHLIREERVVWLRASSRSRVSVAPLLASDRRGVAVSLSF